MQRVCRAFFVVSVFTAICAGLSTRADDLPANVPDFEAQILPIFRAKCLRCHGEKSLKGELDLRTLDGVMTGGESGPAIVPGKPDESVLFEKIHGGAMPPAKKDRLPEAVITSIRRWIESGNATTATSTTVVTQHDVIPIFLRHCTVCHGARRQEAGLDLRTRGAILLGGKSGPAIDLLHPGESLILRRIHDGEMPPHTRLVEASVKPVDRGEVEMLVRWIAAGAPEMEIEPDVATTTPDPLVTDKDRGFWSFRAPRDVAIPAVQHQSLIRNPIDAFILRKLEASGLTFSPEADRLTLLRRVSFDLTGLPPEPSEVEAYLADHHATAYETMVDRLLASPRYGERWGRYWLDLAGYADSEGKREQDLPRPHAWRYRDYVIQAFNSDKPYDRFLTEQLAGDELADAEHAPEITREIYDNLVATGFLRMVPDATWANITGYVPDRIEVIADEIDVLGSSILGLTMKCARCHSHKYDPIPQRDYYRLVDVFKGALDEYDWLKPEIKPGIGPVSVDVLPGRHLPFVTTAERRDWEANEGRLDAEIASVRSSGGNTAEIDAKIKAIESRRTPEPRVQALWDRGEPSPTYLYRRGDWQSPGRLVGPGVPSVLTDGKTPFEVTPPWPNARKTGRRLAFARWLTQPDHPLTARVAVNRIWQRHFGKGIVTTVANFGKAGDPPTHPELLDWLAREFVKNRWSMKHLHRLILTSATYRQTSRVLSEQAVRDPDNALYSRMPLVRLDAESLYDTLLLASGRLDETLFGPADPVEMRADGLVTPKASEHGWRRMIYVRQTRKQLPTHLENFDYPSMNPNCIERRDSTVAPQALHLMNNGMIHTLADHFAERVIREAGDDPSRQVDRVYLIGLSRVAEGDEKRLGVESLSRFSTEWSRTVADPDEASRRALSTYCHAIMNSAGFLYVD